MVSNQDTTTITTPWNSHHIPICVLYSVWINDQPCSSWWMRRRKRYWLLSSPYFLVLVGGEVAVMVLGKLRSRGELASDQPISSQNSQCFGTPPLDPLYPPNGPRAWGHTGSDWPLIARTKPDRAYHFISKIISMIISISPSS